MIVVIQCASKKRADAGRWTTAGGTTVMFVAQPDIAPKRDDIIYCRPDEPADAGGTWRDALYAYNRVGQNPRELLPAWKLYTNPAYAALVGRFGIDGVYILSAGWGLIRADFLTPDYDITFSYIKEPEEKYKRRRKDDRYNDFHMLHPASAVHVVFFGGKEYVPHFCRLTEGVRGDRTVVYNSVRAPEAPGCSLLRFKTDTLTNWHYGAVHALLDGTLRL